MGWIDDILSAFDRSAVLSAPAEMDELKSRVADLETKLNGKWPAEVCRCCGERAARLDHGYPSTDTKGNVRESWKCEGCGKYDERIYRPSPR